MTDPDRPFGWTMPEHIRIEHDVPAMTITLVCEHGHAEGTPTRDVRHPEMFDYRIAAFMKAHRHAPVPCTCGSPDGPHHPNCSIVLQKASTQ